MAAESDTGADVGQIKEEISELHDQLREAQRAHQEADRVGDSRAADEAGQRAMDILDEIGGLQQDLAVAATQIQSEIRELHEQYSEADRAHTEADRLGDDRAADEAGQRAMDILEEIGGLQEDFAVASPHDIAQTGIVDYSRAAGDSIPTFSPIDELIANGADPEQLARAPHDVVQRMAEEARAANEQARLDEARRLHQEYEADPAKAETETFRQTTGIDLPEHLREQYLDDKLEEAYEDLAGGHDPDEKDLLPDDDGGPGGPDGQPAPSDGAAGRGGTDPSTPGGGSQPTPDDGSSPAPGGSSSNPGDPDTGAEPGGTTTGGNGSEDEGDSSGSSWFDDLLDSFDAATDQLDRRGEWSSYGSGEDTVYVQDGKYYDADGNRLTGEDAQAAADRVKASDEAHAANMGEDEGGEPAESTGGPDGGVPDWVDPERVEDWRDYVEEHTRHGSIKIDALLGGAVDPHDDGDPPPVTTVTGDARDFVKNIEPGLAPVDGGATPGPPVDGAIDYGPDHLDGHEDGPRDDPVSDHPDGFGGSPWADPDAGAAGAEDEDEDEDEAAGGTHDDDVEYVTMGDGDGAGGRGGDEQRRPTEEKPDQGESVERPEAAALVDVGGVSVGGDDPTAEPPRPEFLRQSPESVDASASPGADPAAVPDLTEPMEATAWPEEDWPEDDWAGEEPPELPDPYVVEDPALDDGPIDG